MFVVISCMLTGIAVGYLIRRWKIRFIHGFILTFIWLLLFLLGLEVGANDIVIKQFGKLGFDAFILATGGTLGSVVAAWVLWLTVRNKSISK
ncbi:MAG: LysO family transporter [Paludibacter sp.]|nr:LysO family transporter [Paludibacter sp.]